MDLGGWLRGLGLEQYEAAFRENEIDETLLPRLTADDLKELGVALVGHRRKLLDAIAALRPEAKESRLYRIPTIEGSLKIDPAERRQVTVMFCDLVGSTALAARMDPEDLGEVITAYQRCTSEIVRRHDGFVARYLGDGILVFFGYPNAHEDDAERAVRTGLDVVSAVSALQLGAPLQTRIGIATGLVVVGDLMGEAHELDIFGETPNLAARLQMVAEPNMVTISEGTRRLLGNLFQLQDLGAKELKGIAGPVRVWAALRERSVESRFDALHAAGLTTLVGRDGEADLLLRCWAKAKRGHGQVVLLSGEAGIGKSRLTVALMERVASEPHARLRYFCSPQHTNSALYPIIGQMERAAGIAHDDPPHVKLDKLNALLGQTSTPVEAAALFAELLSLPNNGHYPPLELTPQQRRQKTLEALTEQASVLASKHPVLMVFEDAHWIDPTSLEAIDRTVDRIKSLPALLTVTFRPEFNAPWQHAHVTRLPLNRLGKREATAIIAGLAGNMQLPPEVTAQILERTDGIPLFVEEMTKAVLETKDEVEAHRTTAAVSVSTAAVPPSLHASLMARLDRLGEAKKVAQIGAAIGREFPHALVAAVAREPELELAAALDRLVAAGLLSRQGIPPQATYLFKHALVQDAAYGTLLREQRRALHARIAKALEIEFAEIAERQPELLARHCAEAGLIEKAAGLWGKAGQRSLGRSALVEAAEQFTRALVHFAALPATPVLRREQIKFQVALINPLIHIKGHASPETKAAVEQARQLIEQAEAIGEPPDDSLLLFSVLYGFWVANFVSFNGDRICELAAQFLALAEKQGAAAPLMIGHRLMGISLQHTGALVEGRAHLDRGVALYNPIEHRSLAARFGQDPRASTLAFRSLALWVLGYPEAAFADIHRALKEAHEIDQAGTLLYTLAVASRTFVAAGKYAEATSIAEELVTLANEKGAVLWKALGMADKGCIMALTGKALDGVQTMTPGIATFRSTGATFSLPLYLSYLARAHAELGQFDDAWRCIGDAMEAAVTTKETWCEADLHRIAGEIARMSPDNDTTRAEAYFERALALSREQQAKSWELRAAMSMARLRRDQGKRQEASDLLASVYGWFTEGFDTLDLKQAKTMLDEMTA
jgi:class 3 adenylate cyclase/predicted ATPase